MRRADLDTKLRLDVTKRILIAMALVLAREAICLDALVSAQAQQSSASCRAPEVFLTGQDAQVDHPGILPSRSDGWQPPPPAFASDHPMPPQVATTARPRGNAWSSPATASLASVGVVVYSQPPRQTGGIIRSSLRDPDGSDSDAWAWDGFSFAQAQSITEVRWCGAYDPATLGSGGPVVRFTIAIHASIAGGSQPDVVHLPLAHYELSDNAGETPAAILGGVQTYDYHYVLPSPFQAAAQTKYWIQIEAFQSAAPDWGLASATGGDGMYFRRIVLQGYTYQLGPGDVAFALLAPGSNGYSLYLPAIQNNSYRGR